MGLVRLITVLLLTVFAVGCATSGAVPKPFPGAPTGEAPAPEPVSPEAVDASAIVETALSFRGVPYRNGGSDPTGFDCSGLVQYVFAQHGVALPRETREQFEMGTDVRLAGTEPGDLIFFRTTASGPSHVGVAIGGDEFVHAPSTRGVVRVERFSAPYWASRIVGVRRIHESTKIRKGAKQKGPT
jgi:cell wall-associated NlpC family hydrolase